MSPRLPPWILLLSMLASLIAARPAQAQSSVRAPGKAYFNLGLQYQSSDRFFNAQGASRQGRELEQTIVSAYAEVGVVERWLMLSLSADLLRRNVITDTGATTGLGDLRIGAWTEWAAFGPLRLLSGLQFGLPTGDSAPEGDGDPVNDLVAKTLPTGDGEFDIEPSVLLSGSFGPESWFLRHYVVAQGGYWIRTEGFSDALSYRLEVGSQLAVPGWDFFWLTLRVRGVEAFEFPEAGGAAGGIGLGNGVSFTTVGAETQIRLPYDLSLGFGVETPLRGTAILDATSARATLAFEL